ncbi:unnamed protein product [Pleuronectes platessa]|uniref:C2 domain-containing protein n=1 Tax=Pleuronectes platessa TaxID=8262 RepID=A0A9N7Y831_PLEPL|nr:unnamed protein product [Pleuronectes platessa]
MEKKMTSKVKDLEMESGNKGEEGWLIKTGLCPSCETSSSHSCYLQGSSSGFVCYPFISIEMVMMRGVCGCHGDGMGNKGGTKKLRSTIRRSTETGIAVEMRNRVTRQGSKESTDGSTNSNSSDGTFVFPTTRLGPESQFSDFLDGLGPAQIVGRQTLATPPMGDVHVGMVDRGGQLEVEVNQARGLIPKPGSKNIPTTYVKVYVLENGVCLAKKKTKVVKRNLDPTYQQALLFDESPQGKVLQVSDNLAFVIP